MEHIFIGFFLFFSCIILAQNNAILTTLKNYDYGSAIQLIPKDPETTSYYNVVENRIREIKAELASKKKKSWQIKYEYK